MSFALSAVECIGESMAALEIVNLVKNKNNLGVLSLQRRDVISCSKSHCATIDLFLFSFSPLIQLTWCSHFICSFDCHGLVDGTSIGNNENWRQ